jgi:hypothetical protein
MTLPPPPLHAPTRLVMATRTIVRFITWCSEDLCRVGSVEKMRSLMIFTSAMLRVRLNGKAGCGNRDAYGSRLTERVVHRDCAGSR